MVSGHGASTGHPDLDVIVEVLRHMPTAAFVTDAGQATGKPRILFVNDAAITLTGYSFEQMEGRSPLMLVREEHDLERLEIARQAFAAGEVHRSRTVQVRPDGTQYHVDWAMSPVHDPAGDARYFVWIETDVSTEVGATQMRDTLFEALNLSDDSVIISSDAGIEFVNSGFRRLSGLRDEDVLGRGADLLDVVSLDWRTLEPILEPSPAARHLIRSRDRRGDHLYLDVATTIVTDPLTGTHRSVHLGKDVSEEIRQRLDERSRAQHDVLTGLYNRRGGEEILEGALAHARADGGAFSVIMGDLDRFKVVNDTHGHEAGDRVLQTVSTVLAQQVRSADSVIRWGGEEFLVAVPGAAAEVAAELAERLRERVGAAELPIAGNITISMGVAEWGLDEDLGSMIARADAALYASKAAGRNRITLAPPAER